MTNSSKGNMRLIDYLNYLKDQLDYISLLGITRVIPSPIDNELTTSQLGFTNDVFRSLNPERHFGDQEFSIQLVNDWMGKHYPNIPPVPETNLVSIIKLLRDEVENHITLVSNKIGMDGTTRILREIDWITELELRGHLSNDILDTVKTNITRWSNITRSGDLQEDTFNKSIRDGDVTRVETLKQLGDLCESYNLTMYLKIDHSDSTDNHSTQIVHFEINWAPPKMLRALQLLVRNDLIAVTCNHDASISIYPFT